MRLHGLALSFIATLIALVFAQPARANVMIVIDKSAQKMTVTVNGEERYVWPVSTGHSGYDTPRAFPAVPHGKGPLFARVGRRADAEFDFLFEWLVAMEDRDDP